MHVVKVIQSDSSGVSTSFSVTLSDWCRYSKLMPLVPRVRATKGSLFSAWNGSESSFACCHCQEIASVVHSASSSSSNSSSDIELRVSLAVNQMFRSFTCDLRKCESPWRDLHGWLNIKHPSTFFTGSDNCLWCYKNRCKKATQIMFPYF